MKKMKIKAAIFVSALMLAACGNVQSEIEKQEIHNEAQANVNIISVTENLECYFSSLDPSCIQFELIEKEKLFGFFSGHQIDTKNLVKMEKRLPSGLITNYPFTIYLINEETNEVIYEVNYYLTNLIGNSIQSKVEYIEITDYSNNRKLYMDNSIK